MPLDRELHIHFHFGTDAHQPSAQPRLPELRVLAAALGLTAAARLPVLVGTADSER